ncbi:MAG TPA: hypothetical protein VLE49_20900, partial [Anaerolineales bacterium]|nr:hypothetical protein [Anaerolineales bacterium]
PEADLVQEGSEGTLDIPSGKLLLEVLDADYRFSRLEVLNLADQKIEPYPLNIVDGTLFLYPSPDHRYWVLDQWPADGSGGKEAYYLTGPEIDEPLKIIEADGISGGSWSPDSRLFAFGSTMDEGIRIYDTATGALKKLPIQLFNPSVPAFSPSGDRIAFAGGGECTADMICDDGIFLINPDGSNEIRLGDGVFSHADADIRWTPDGSSVFAKRYYNGLSMIHKFDVATRSDTLVSSEHEQTFNLHPSPDSRYLAFEQQDEVSGYLMIHVIGIDPQNNLPERVVTGNGPVWSPDGKYIAYVSGDATASHIFILEVDTGKEARAYTMTGPENKYPLGWLP